MTLSAKAWNQHRVVPLVTIANPEHTTAVIDALLEGGIEIIELALRTPKALSALELAARDGRIAVAAGTVTNVAQLRQVISAGAQVAICPAWSDSISEEAKRHGFPLLPAIATPSEALRAMEFGHTQLKVFPADLLGGTKFVSTLGSVFPQLSFLVSGGVNQENAASYLVQANVFAVSGSWIAPAELIEQGEFEEITRRAKIATELAK